MRNNPALHFDYDAAFSSLSASEFERGSALRIPRCVRGSSEDDVAWVVLHFCRQDDPEMKPAVRGVLPFTNPDPIIFGPLTTSFSPSEGEDAWYVQEFEVVLPLSLRMFSVRCGDATTKMTWKERNRLLDGHYEEIAHAAVDSSYPDWVSARRSKPEVPSSGPLMSIVSPVYRTPSTYLSAMIDSVLGQSYRNWELVIVNASPDDEGVSRVLSAYRDDRIRVIDHPENDGISGNTNVGIAAVRGDYVSFLDHDDIVETDALASMVEVIVASEERIDLLYCDEDSINEAGAYCLPLFKPSLNPDLLYSNNYAIHWLTVSKKTLGAVDRSSRDVDGAQDYDLTLKAIEVSRNVVHIPRVLYHWRIHQGSTNVNPDSKPYAQMAGARAIKGHFERCGLRARVSLEEVPCTYRSIFDISVHGDCSIACILETSDYSDVLTHAIDEYRRTIGLQCSVTTGGFDDIARLKQALSVTSESLILFCRYAIGKVDAGSLAVMVGYFQRDDVAAVSPKIIRQDGLVDYAGTCICPNGDMMYLNRFLPKDDGGYVGRSQRPYDGFVLNPDCFMVRRELLEDFLEKVGEDDSETNWCPSLFAEFFSAGLRCVYTPFSCLHDAEYKTLLDYGTNYIDDETRRLFTNRYGELFINGDPSHNPNFDPYSPYYRLNW